MSHELARGALAASTAGPDAATAVFAVPSVETALPVALLLLFLNATLAGYGGLLLGSVRLRMLAGGLVATGAVATAWVVLAGASGFPVLFPVTAQAVLLVMTALRGLAASPLRRLTVVIGIPATAFLPELLSVGVVVAASAGTLLLVPRSDRSPVFVVSALLLVAAAGAVVLGRNGAGIGAWMAAEVALSLGLWRVAAEASRAARAVLSIFRDFPDPLAVVDRHGMVVAANRAAERATAAYRGADSHRHLHPADTAREQCDLCDWTATAAVPASFPIVLRGRRQFVTVVPFGGRDGGWALQLLRDREERLRAEAARVRTNSRYRSLVENAYEGIALAAPDGRLLGANHRMGELTGYSKEQLLRLSVFDLHPPSDRTHLDRLFARLAAGESSTTELWFLRPDSTQVPVEVTAVAQQIGDETTYVGSFRDISARLRAETALRQSEARQRAIFEHAGIGIQLSGRDGLIVEVNRAFLDMHGGQSAAVIGRHWRHFVHPGDALSDSDAFALIERACAAPQLITERRVRSDGSTFWADVTLTAAGDGGCCGFLVALIHDVDQHHLVEQQRRQHAAELQAAWHAAEQASAAKTRFLATASHDLRQPIQAAQLLVHLLASRQVEPDAALLVTRVHDAVDGLGGMIDSLLDISKLDAGLIHPNWEACRVGPLLQQIAAELRPTAAEKGLTLRVAGTGAVVRTDRGLLMRILRNLVSNAVRYTDRGGVVLGCRRRGSGLRLQVVDTGVGIAERELTLIFQEFHQLGNAARDRREGLGLGLAIVDRLARLLDYPLSVRSTVGRGTCFSVDVPLAEAAEVPLPVNGQLTFPMERAGALVLVVDDEADIRDGLVQVLRGWGYRVVSAGDADSALAQLDPADPPALLLVDYRLGDMSGIELVKAVRRRLHARPHALLLTGDATAECQREAALNEVVSLHKPVGPQKLREELSRLLSARRTRGDRRRKATGGDGATGRRPREPS